MQWLRFRAVFPWRIALLFALILTIPLLIFGAWFRWELQPLERYYLPAYWESSEGAKHPEAPPKSSGYSRQLLGGRVSPLST